MLSAFNKDSTVWKFRSLWGCISEQSKILLGRTQHAVFFHYISKVQKQPQKPDKEEQSTAQHIYVYTMIVPLFCLFLAKGRKSKGLMLMSCICIWKEIMMCATGWKGNLSFSWEPSLILISSSHQVELHLKPIQSVRQHQKRLVFVLNSPQPVIWNVKAENLAPHIHHTFYVSPASLKAFKSLFLKLCVHFLTVFSSQLPMSMTKIFDASQICRGAWLVMRKWECSKLSIFFYLFGDLQLQFSQVIL